MKSTNKELTSARASKSQKEAQARRRGGKPPEPGNGNSSVAPGIYPRKRLGFKAVHTGTGKPIVIGYFPTLEEAKAARKAYMAGLR